MNEQQALDLIDELAMSGYTAYADSTDNLNFRGDVMPDWIELPKKQRMAWRAATLAIVQEVRS